jgi:hypothetical protein
MLFLNKSKALKNQEIFRHTCQEKLFGYLMPILCFVPKKTTQSIIFAVPTVKNIKARVNCVFIFLFISNLLLRHPNFPVFLFPPFHKLPDRFVINLGIVFISLVVQYDELNLIHQILADIKISLFKALRNRPSII